MAGRTALHMACSTGQLPAVLLLSESDLHVIHMVDSGGDTPIQLASREGHMDCVRALLSILPSTAAKQDALQVASSPKLRRQITRIPLIDWQRQLGLQDEHLCVERALCVFDDALDSLALLVLQHVVLRQTRFLFQLSQQHGRAIPERALEWHKRKWFGENPDPEQK